MTITLENPSRDSSFRNASIDSQKVTLYLLIPISMARLLPAFFRGSLETLDLGVGVLVDVVLESLFFFVLVWIFYVVLLYLNRRNHTQVSAADNE